MVENRELYIRPIKLEDLKSIWQMALSTQILNGSYGMRLIFLIMLCRMMIFAQKDD